MSDYLKKFARRMLAVQAWEAALLAAIRLSLCALAVELGYIVFPASWFWALVFTMLAFTACFAAPLASGRKWQLFGTLRRWLKSKPALSAYFDSVKMSGSALKVTNLLAGAFSLCSSIWLLTKWRYSVDHAIIAASVVAAGAVIAAVVTVLEGFTRRQAALWLDRAGNLGERLITAYELGDSDSDFACAVKKQAYLAFEQAQPHKNKCGRTGIGAKLTTLAAFVAVIALGLVDPMDSNSRIAQQRRTAALSELSEQLLTDAKQQETQTANKQLAEHFEQMQKLSQSMRWGEVSPERAVSEMNRLENKLRDSMKKAKAFQSAADRLSRMAKAGESPEQSPAAKMSSALGDDKLESLGKEISAKMASGELSQNQADKWADTLDAAADAAGSDSELSDALARASEAMRQMDEQMFSDAMKDLSDSAGDARSSAASSEQLARAASELSSRKEGFMDSLSGSGSSLGAGDIDQAMARAAGSNGGGSNSGNESSGNANNGDQNGQGSQDGQGGQGQSGQSGQGQGAQGQGDGSSGSSGSGGNGGSGSGAGSGGGAAAGSGGSTNRDNPGGPGGNYEGDAFNEGKWARIYAPKEIEHTGPQVRPTGQVDPTKSEPVERMEFNAPAAAGESYVPYEKAWQSAKQRNESDIGNQRIPARMRKLVRDYYDSQ